MNFFDHEDLGNHLLQLCPKVVKHPVYFVSDYTSDLEDKLQAYIKINGIIRRHFGKQMTTETKLRIHNIIDKEAFKCGSEPWVLKEREEQRLEAAEKTIFKSFIRNY